jgi:hypothetical protein
MVNVALPLVIVDDADASKADMTEEGYLKVPRKSAFAFTQWMLETMMSDYHTFIALGVIQDRWWARLSAQVYLDLDDFEWTGKTLKELCERAAGLDMVSGKGA